MPDLFVSIMTELLSGIRVLDLTNDSVRAKDAYLQYQGFKIC